MDFFDAQDRAKRNTGKLLALYLAAVILIIASVYIVSLFVLGFAGEAGALQIWQPGLFFTVAVFVLILIISGTLFRISQLRKGGSAVAEMLGGRKAEPSSTNAGERRLINIVEEMSIASGLPMPDIYILDQEENINAFAAGFGTDDAAVGVTRGAIDQLSRDELQGVIAHEFSHIFNGDMRLNIRLIGILNGILLLHIMGMILMRSSILSGGRMRSSGGRGGGSGGQSAIAMVLLGVALIVIGYIGMLFGRMIQAAVSRQREYLADAAAVQYTRNPDGIAGALEKIGRTKKGGKINDGHAMELSHLFFASSFSTSFDKLFATHPPLDKRISAIRVGSDPEDLRKKEKIDGLLEKDRIQRQTSSEKTKAEDRKKGPISETLPAPEILLAMIGTMDGSGVNEAGELLKKIPKELIDSAHEPLRAEALIYSLLLANRNDPSQKLPEWCTKILDPYMCEQVEQLLPLVFDGKREWSLPLAEISMPALRKMSESQYRIFRKNLHLIIEHDLKVSLFEFAIEKLVERRLDIHFKDKKTPKIKHHHLKTLSKEISIMLSALANSSKTDSQKAWQAGVKAMNNAAPDDLNFLPKDEYTLKDLDKALDELSVSANPVKRRLLSAMIHCVLSDDKLTIEELELLRAISESIGSPIPLHVMPR